MEKHEKRQPINLIKVNSNSRTSIIGGLGHHVVAPGSLFHGGRHLERKLPRKEIAAAAAVAATTTSLSSSSSSSGWRVKA